MQPHRTIHPAIFLLPLLFFIVLFFLYYNLPLGQDWVQFFQPAALAMLKGKSPYGIKDFHNAPWTLLPLIPFALMPYRLGRIGMFLVSYMGFAYVALKMKAKPITMVLFMTSYPVISCLYGGGLDWMPMLAFIMPAPFSLIFAVTKPQVGVGIALYWLIESWKAGGVKMLLRNFYPVVLLLVISFSVYGFWIMTFLGKWNSLVNISPFPFLIPVGVYLLCTGKKHAAIASSICFAPYYTFYSLSAPLVALLEHEWLLLIVWISLWIYPLVNLFSR